MDQRTKRYLWIAVGVITTLTIFNLPDRVDLDDACEPKSILNQVRAAVNGSRYWRSQLALLELEVARISAMPAQRARLEALSSSISAQTNWTLDSIYAMNPALGPRPRPTLSESLRTAAEQLDMARTQDLLYQVMAQRADLLIQCRANVLRAAR